MTQTREHWSSRIGFILAAIGSAVGLGVLWMFPYVVGKNGGGLFLFAYILCIVLIGIPVFIGELIIGRHAQKASVEAFSHLSPGRPFWKLAGVLGFLSSFFIMSYYSVIAGYGMSYILMSLTGAFQGETITSITNMYDTLVASGSISLFWHALFTIITVGIVVSGVRKGIEFWAKHITRALFLLLGGLFLYSMSLPGFFQAFRYLFYPNLETFHPSSILEALGLAFFTLSLGQGIMISYGSYMKKGEDIPKMACIVSGAVIIVSILAALTIFPVIFTFNYSPNGGPGLIFKTLPYLFFRLPGSLLLSTLFFILFVLTALTSAVPFVEVVTTNIMEMFNCKRGKTACLVGIATFVFGIPSALTHSPILFRDWSAIYKNDFLETLNQLVSVWLIPVGGLLTSLFLGWRMNRRVMRIEFSSGSKWKSVFTVWSFFIQYVVPVLIIAIIAQKSGLLDIDQLFQRIGH